MQRAKSPMMPELDVPAAPDIHEAASYELIPSMSVPPHDYSGAGGQSSSDTHSHGATIPTLTSAGNGHGRRDTQPSVATPALTQERVEPSRNGHRLRVDLGGIADLDRLHALLGHYARQLWDVQAERIAVSNRIGAMERDGLGDYAEPIRARLRACEETEKATDRELTKIARQHFMADWITAQRGIGLPGFARILGVTGSLDRFSTVSKLWKYLGLHVVDGHAPKREKGVPWTHTNCQGGHLLTCTPDCTTDHHPSCVPGGIGTAYAPQGRVICHQIAESIVKVGSGGPYRAAYDQKKAYYEDEREDWSQARRHNAAMRYAVKMLLKEMWIEWHRYRGMSHG